MLAFVIMFYFFSFGREGAVWKLCSKRICAKVRWSEVHWDSGYGTQVIPTGSGHGGAESFGEKKEFCSVFVQFHFLEFSLSRVLMYVWLMMDGGFFISSSHEIIPEASSFSLMINYVLFIGFIFILIKNGYYMNRILSHFDCSRDLSSRQWFIWFTEMGNSTILLA